MDNSENEILYLYWNDPIRKTVWNLFYVYLLCFLNIYWVSRTFFWLMPQILNQEIWFWWSNVLNQCMGVSSSNQYDAILIKMKYIFKIKFKNLLNFYLTDFEKNFCLFFKVTFIFIQRRLGWKLTKCQIFGEIKWKISRLNQLLYISYQGSWVRAINSFKWKITLNYVPLMTWKWRVPDNQLI